MKKHLTIVAAAFALLGFASCESASNLKYNSNTPRQYARASVITEPVILEIDTVMPNLLRDTVTFEIPNMGSTEMNRTYFEDNADRYIDNTLTIMAANHGVDEIINFRYTAEVVSVYKYNQMNTGTEATADPIENRILVVYASGYGVKYKAMRKATKDDVWMSNFNK